MEKQEFRTHLNQRVRLKGNGEDGLYSLAAAGSEGWVRGQKLDPLGYPLVQIEWDRNHWTYNGESDKWTFEAHFDPIKEDKPMAEQNPEQIAQIIAAVMAQMQDTPNVAPAETPEIAAEPPESPEAVLADLQESAKCIAESDSKPHAYVLVAMEEVEPGVWNPHVHSRYASTEAGRVLELYIAKLGFLNYQDLLNLHLALTQGGGVNES